MTSEEILSGLNDDQKAVVLDYNGPRFVVAGPGAGKTHTVVTMAQYMVHEGINGRRLLMFTFTNKAAKEIKERVIKKIGKSGEDITVGTYHSVCARFLRMYAEQIGFTKKFTIFDEEDSTGVLKQIVKGTNYDHAKLGDYISKCKDQLVTPTKAIQNARTNDEIQLSSMYQSYQTELIKQDAMDFDDLIANTITLFERCPDVLQEINSRYHYIVADEFHDSSKRDIRFIQLLAGERHNVCMILDDEQSIYSFRGADLDAVLSVREKFPDLKTYILRRNYRSTKMIVNASRSLIKKNQNQIEKEIFTANEDGVPVIHFEEFDQSNESLRVLKTISLLKSKYGLQYKDIAVLYRMSYLSRSIEDKLLMGGIPYKIIGGTPFYSRKEIKDVLCYARLLFNPHDFEALKRVINVPKRGIGEVNVQKVFDYARTHYAQPISLIQACRELPTKGKIKESFDSFNRIISTLEDNFEKDTPAEFVNRIMRLTNYRQMILDTETITKAEDRLANLVELIELASSFESMEEFIQNTALNTNDDNDPENDDKVELLTMHSSKGLEWPAVIIVDAVEGITPHWKSVGDQKKLDEERRLFYVAMTRAQKYLFITCPKNLMQQGSLQRAIESRFVREIDKQYLKRYQKN